MPSPVLCTMYPSYRRTASIISFNAGSMIARASSGSRSCSSSVDPLISANSAVIVLRSPSRFSGEILSAATRTSEADPRGGEVDGAVLGASAAPQSSQNADEGAFSAPHFGHRLEIGLPHTAQNFLP